MSYLHGKFVWFEHFSNDVAAARRFYDALFDWRSEGVDMGGGALYHLIHNGADGIGGFREAMPGMPNHWLSYLSVADVDATAAAAVAAGGKMLMPPTDFSAFGRAACLADPTGAVFSVWKDSQGDRPDADPTATGDWCWNELLTAEPASALAFYQQLFGYTRQTMDMGAAGPYHVLKAGGIPRAGVMKNPTPGVPAFWLPYVHVSDPEASAARAAELGAQILVPAREIAGIGRFAVILDPLHAAFAVYRPQYDA